MFTQPKARISEKMRWSFPQPEDVKLETELLNAINGKKTQDNGLFKEALSTVILPKAFQADRKKAVHISVQLMYNGLMRNEGGQRHGGEL